METIIESPLAITEQPKKVTVFDIGILLGSGTRSGSSGSSGSPGTRPVSYPTRIPDGFPFG